MSHKTAIQECLERSNRLDFMHWFHANREELLTRERLLIQRAYLSGQASALEDDGVSAVEYYNDFHGQTDHS